MADGEGEVYRRAGRLFDELCERDPAEQAAALELTAATDPEAVELARRMLARDAGVGVLDLVSPGGDPLAGADGGDPAGVLGTAVGPYRIEALLGHGGMGAVYLGRRRDPDARVAIKFISLSAASAAALERFRSEVRLLARIEHPGVVRYRDSGVDARGRPYLAMDFVDGAPLSCALPEIRDDVRSTVAIVAAVAEAVHYLHQRRVLHRDLKPSNVILTRVGERAVPIVIDLGIARVLVDDDAAGRDGSRAAQVTGTLGLGPVGTPVFMSPEQTRAEVLPDVRIDVHALGAVLYALLTGHPPRDLDRFATSDPAEFHRRLQETEASAPSQAVDPATFGGPAARRRARAIDRDLDAIVLMALALDPNERYGSAEAFAADLQAWLAGAPVSARLVGPLGRLRRVVRRRPLESLMTAAVAATLIVALVLIARSRAAEVEARGRYEEQLVVSRELNRFFTEDVLLRAMPERDGPDMPVGDLLRAAARSSAARTDRPPIVSVAVGGALMEVFERLGASVEADAELARAAPLAGALPPEEPQRLLFDLRRAEVESQRSRWEPAERLFHQVLETLAGMRAAPAELEVRAASGLGSVLLSRGRLAEARPWLERALARFDAELGPSTSGAASLRWSILLQLAELSWSEGELEAAVPALEELLQDVEQKLGPSSFQAMGLHSELAGLHLDRRRPNEALPHARKAVELANELLDATQPARLTALNQLASCLSSAGAYDEAVALREEVYAGRRERLGSDNPSVGIALNNLASTLVRAGRAAEAVDLAAEALDILLATLGDTHPTTAGAFLTLAVTEELTGARAVALELYDTAIEIYERAEGDHSIELEQALARRAVAAGTASAE